MVGTCLESNTLPQWSDSTVLNDSLKDDFKSAKM